MSKKIFIPLIVFLAALLVFLMMQVQGGKNPVGQGESTNQEPAQYESGQHEQTPAPNVSAEFELHTDHAVTASSQSAEALRPEDVPDDNPNFATVRERIDAMALRRPSISFSDDEVLAAVQKSEAWELMNSVPSDTPLSEEELYDGKREFIEVDPMRLESLMPGDQLSLPDPEGSTDLTLVITKVRPEAQHDLVTWEGHIVEYGPNDSHFSMTRGSSLTSAIISTPDNNFTLEVFDTQGSVVNSSETFVGESDPIVPPDEEPVEPHSHEH